MERTAHLLHLPSSTSIVSAVATPFRLITGFFRTLEMARSRVDALQRLSEQSDEALAAKGLTRAEAINDIFSDQFHA